MPLDYHRMMIIFFTKHLYDILFDQFVLGFLLCCKWSIRSFIVPLSFVSPLIIMVIPALSRLNLHFADFGEWGIFPNDLWLFLLLFHFFEVLLLHKMHLPLFRLEIFPIHIDLRLQGQNVSLKWSLFVADLFEARACNFLENVWLEFMQVFDFVCLPRVLQFFSGIVKNRKLNDIAPPIRCVQHMHEQLVAMAADGGAVHVFGEDSPFTYHNLKLPLPIFDRSPFPSRPHLRLNLSRSLISDFKIAHVLFWRVIFCLHIPLVHSDFFLSLDFLYHHHRRHSEIDLRLHGLHLHGLLDRFFLVQVLSLLWRLPVIWVVPLGVGVGPAVVIVVKHCRPVLRMDWRHLLIRVVSLSALTEIRTLSTALAIAFLPRPIFMLFHELLSLHS